MSMRKDGGKGSIVFALSAVKEKMVHISGGDFWDIEPGWIVKC